MTGSSRVIGCFQPEANNDDEILEILRLLDPAHGHICVKCFGNKANGDIVCSNCALRCPDPDCRGNKLKNPCDAMCEHCRYFMEGLDQKDGFSLIREGYFVYQLDTGYIGMTYNPSKRQLEHKLRQRIENRKSSDEPIWNPKAYIQSAWVSEYVKHWEQVRRSDRRYIGERKIQWLSPKLESREDAFKSEWGLKALKDRATTDFGRITSLSSAPVIRLASSKLEYDSDTRKLMFRLKWKLSDDLGPSQIVPVQRYEMQHFDGEVGNYGYTTYTIEPNSSDKKMVSHSFELSSMTGKVCRVRAINDMDVPGPWAEFRVSSARMENAVWNLVGLRAISCRLIDEDFNGGQVELRWQVSNNVAGLSFDIERRVDSGDFSRLGTIEFGITRSYSFVDNLKELDKGKILNYRLRVNLYGSFRHCSIGEVRLDPILDSIRIIDFSRGQGERDTENRLVKRLWKWRMLNDVPGLTINVERKVDNNAFCQIKTLTFNRSSSYSFVDDIPEPGERYSYRLRINLDGASKSYSFNVDTRRDKSVYNPRHKRPGFQCLRGGRKQNQIVSRMPSLNDADVGKRPSFKFRDKVRLKDKPRRTGIVMTSYPGDDNRYKLTMRDTGKQEWYSSDMLELINE